ncbi:MAG: urea carboxylase-associated family protein [Ruminococcus sp.]|nr:urea carboxylase-associated family protein [Ruminococcus sp.]
MSYVKEKIIIPPYSARSVKVLAGETLRITDVEGKQVGDFICYNANDLKEHVSPVHMRSSLSSIRLKIGDFLYSNIRDHLMQFTADTVGKHDFFFPACDYYRYKVDFGVEDHPNCHDNLCKALEKFDIFTQDIPDPINWFMNNEMNEFGDYTIKEPLSKPGDYVELLAVKDCICALSTCSQDFVPVNGNDLKITPLMIEVIVNE